MGKGGVIFTHRETQLLMYLVENDGPEGSVSEVIVQSPPGTHQITSHTAHMTSSLAILEANKRTEKISCTCAP